jgi:hypothetical protein
MAATASDLAENIETSEIGDAGDGHTKNGLVPITNLFYPFNQPLYTYYSIQYIQQYKLKGRDRMEFKTKLWQRGIKSFATTVPHIALLNLDPGSKKYNVVWQFNDRMNKWTVSFEEV